MTVLDDRLENWGRVMRVHRRRGRCLSMEGSYRSPQRNHWEAPVQTLRRDVDIPDAWLVESAWRTLARAHRVILRGHYCLHLSPHILRRMAHRKRRRNITFDEDLALAQAALALALGRSDRLNSIIVRYLVRTLLDNLPKTRHT